MAKMQISLSVTKTSLIAMLWIGCIGSIVTFGPTYAYPVYDMVHLQIAPATPESEDMLMESTPIKPHENVYIEDVEAQLKEAKDEVRSARQEVLKSEEMLKKVKAKNYGDN